MTLGDTCEGLELPRLSKRALFILTLRDILEEKALNGVQRVKSLEPDSCHLNHPPGGHVGGPGKAASFPLQGHGEAGPRPQDPPVWHRCPGLRCSWQRGGTECVCAHRSPAWARPLLSAPQFPGGHTGFGNTPRTVCENSAIFSLSL